MTINTTPLRHAAEIRRTIRNARTIWGVASQSWGTRVPQSVSARQMAAVWLSQKKRLTSREIGVAIGRERTMITTYLQNHRDAMAHDAEYRYRWEEFIEIQNLPI